MSPDATARAAHRDASWYRRPNISTDRKYHVVTEMGGASGLGEAGCGAWLATGSYGNDWTCTAAAVRPFARCMRPGCRVRWPAYEGKP